jgi:hypothetical protein
MRLFLALLLCASSAFAQQSDFTFYRDPDKPLDLSHFGSPGDQFYNLGKTAASASGVVLNADLFRPVRRAHWWVAANFCGGSLEIYDVWGMRQLAMMTDTRCSPVAIGVYPTDAVNAIIEQGRGAFILLRGKGLVQVYSSTLSLVW